MWDVFLFYYGPCCLERNVTRDTQHFVKTWIVNVNSNDSRVAASVTDTMNNKQCFQPTKIAQDPGIEVRHVRRSSTGFKMCGI